MVLEAFPKTLAWRSTGFSRPPKLAAVRLSKTSELSTKFACTLISFDFPEEECFLRLQSPPPLSREQYGRQGVVQKDEHKAFEYYKIAAEKGNEPAKDAVRRLEVNLRPVRTVRISRDTPSP